MANGQDKQSPAIQSSEAAALFGGLGIDVNAIKMQAGAGLGGTVFMGKRPKPPPTALDVYGAEVIEEEFTETVPEAKRRLYRKQPGELRELQRRLFAAGMFDPAVAEEDIRWDDWDDETRTAWERVVERAAAFYDAGEKKTIDEVIDDAMRKRSKSEEEGAGGRKREALTTRLTHPEDIRNAAMRVSTAVLGRGWSEDELNKFVNTFQSMERQSQQSRYAAEGAAGGTFTAAPDAEAAAAAAARASNPQAAGATDWANAYNMLLKSVENLGAGSG